MTSTTPSVTFFISARISSLFLVLGMPPTNRRQLSTLAHTPRSLPFLERGRCLVRSQVSREGKVKAKPLFYPQTRGFGVSCSLGYSSGLAQCKSCHSAKCDIRQHSWNEGFEGEITAKFCFSYLRFFLLLPPGNCTPLTQVLALSPVACGFPLCDWGIGGRKSLVMERHHLRTHQWGLINGPTSVQTPK